MPGSDFAGELEWPGRLGLKYTFFAFIIFVVGWLDEKIRGRLMN